VILVTYPEICSESFLDGLILFSTAVLPSLFPFLFITKMLTDFGLAQKLSATFDKPFRFLFGVNAKGFYVFLMSIICGYPVGAKILSDLIIDGQLSKSEAEDILPLCTSSGPLFVIGTVGVGMFGNKGFGIKLFAVHALSIIVLAFVLCNVKRLIFKKRTTQPLKKSNICCLDQVLAKNMTDTCASVLMVGGFISCFYLAIDILNNFGIMLPISYFLSWLLGIFGSNIELAKGISSGIIEMTRGCKDLALIGGEFSAVAISAILAFGGVSIILQSIAFLSKAKISSLKFLAIKTMQTAVAICIALILF